MPVLGAGEIDVPVSLARSLIDSQFPELRPARVESLGSGWDNHAFRVNGEFVFRFPRRAGAALLLGAEARLMPTIAARVSLQVPEPRFAGVATESYPWPFLGSTRVAGVSACSASLDASARNACAVPLGEFLAALHSLPAHDAIERGASFDTLNRLDFVQRIPAARGRLERLASLALIQDAGPLFSILDSAPNSYQPRNGTLVHGDLYARHLMIDPAQELVGVIDWGDLHVGDPAVDLMVAHAFLPPEAHGEFKRVYGPIDASIWRTARLRALWHTAIVLEYGHQISDLPLMLEARIALNHLAGG